MQTKQDAKQLREWPTKPVTSGDNKRTSTWWVTCKKKKKPRERIGKKKKRLEVWRPVFIDVRPLTTKRRQERPGGGKRHTGKKKK